MANWRDYAQPVTTKQDGGGSWRDFAEPVDAAQPQASNEQSVREQEIADYEAQGGGFLSSMERGGRRLLQSFDDVMGQAAEMRAERARHDLQNAMPGSRREQVLREKLRGSLQGAEAFEQNIRANQQAIGEIPQRPELGRAIAQMQQEEGLVDKVGAFGKELSASPDKTGFLRDMLGEQAANIATTVVGTKGLGSLANAGRAGEMAAVGIGAGGSSFLNTYGSNVAKYLDEGMPLEDARRRGAKRSAIQALTDAGTGAVVPVKIGGSQIVNVPSQTAIQMLGGGGGEYLAALGVDETPEMEDAIMEGLLEAIGLPGDVAAAVSIRKPKSTPEVPGSGRIGQESRQALPAPEETVIHAGDGIGRLGQERRPALEYNPQSRPIRQPDLTQQSEPIYQSDGVPRLPSPDQFPSDTMAVDAAGNARRMSEGEAAEYDRMRQEAESLGVTPDIRALRNRQAEQQQATEELFGDALPTAQAEAAPQQAAPAEDFNTGFGEVNNDPETLMRSRLRIEELDPDAIDVDAKAYQFKGGGDEQGVTDRLRGVKEFDPTLAGVAMVHELEDGSRYIADGHQRLGLAKRAKEAGQKDVSLPARVYREKDGYSAADMRRIAAYKNIAEDSGTSVDAAKVIREGGDLPKTIPQNSMKVRDAIGLAKLSDDTFGAIINDVIKPAFGAIIGNTTDNPMMQQAMVNAMNRLKPSSREQAEIMARDIARTGVDTQEQVSLFGSEMVGESIIYERSKILANAMNRLKKNKAVFKTLSEDASLIQSEGKNKLDNKANETRLRNDEVLLDTLVKLATRTGALSDALTEAARSAKTGKRNVTEATGDFIREVTALSREGGINWADGSRDGSAPQTSSTEAEGGNRESVEEALSQGTLYSNAFADPRLWRKFYNDVLKPFGMSFPQSQEWKQNWGDTLEMLRGSKESRKKRGYLAGLRHFARVAMRSEDGYMQGLAKQYNSPTVLAIKDMLFAEGGAGRTIAQSYHEGVEQRVKTNLNKLGRILEPFGRDKSGLQRLVNLVENPDKVKAGRSKWDDAAISISRLLADERQYMLDAGLDVGEVTEGGYFPTQYATEKIIDDPQRFLDVATRAYQRTYAADGITKQQAQQMAENWLHNIRLGDVNVRAQNNDFQVMGMPAAPSSLKPRVFSKASRDLLRDAGFTITDPVDVLQQHFSRTAPKAEFNRRFGGEKWANLKQRMIDEGAVAAIPDVVNLIRSSTGNTVWNISPSGRRIESFLRAWSILEFLPRAAFASIHEASMNAVSTGSVKQAAKAFNTTFKELYKSSSNDEIRQISEDLLGTTGKIATDMMLTQRMGGHIDSDLVRHVTQNFFRYTGLHQLTEAQRVATVETGRWMIRQLAQDIASRNNKHRSAEFLLQDMGVDPSQAQQFARWVMSRSEGSPSLQDMQEDSQWSKLYQTALMRHVDRTIMNPNASTRPYLSKYPIVSLAYNLQSFLYAFSKNVLWRQMRLAREATKSGKGYSMRDRINLLAPSLMMTIPLVLAGAVGELRDEIYKNPAAAPKKNDKLSYLMRALSRFGAFGAADPWMNMMASIRYRKDPATALVGPLGGNVSGLLKATGDYYMNNSDKTNTAERNLAKAFYANAVQPLANGLFSISPVPLAGAAGIQMVSHPATREKFIQSAAGKKGAKTGGGKGRSRGRGRGRSRSRSSNR